MASLSTIDFSKTLASRYSDLLLASMVVGIVGMMVIPLPTWLLDLFLTANIAIAVVLLLTSIYVSEALKIATFPTMLLLTTLFRLGLNISSTRLILLQADAGQVIYSFGNFVVSGNVIVGAVIFSIITLVQFIVIAKGSERVAEVGARFTLDAMPGKQMAIDADVRSGIVDLNEARRLRTGLQRESQFYGAMDGAMKFVKGDAIAGILIIVVNIVGGLLIGVVQQKMPFAEALQLYAVLTVGDGLVSQIPALLISIAAGIVVTRVASEEEGAHLGKEVSKQFLANPRALLIASGLLLFFAAIPGLPTTPFLVLGVVLGAGGYRLVFEQRRASHTNEQRDELSAFTHAPEVVEPPSAITIEVGTALTSILETYSTMTASQPRSGTMSMNALVAELRHAYQQERGIALPSVHIKGNVTRINPHEYRVLFHEVPLARDTIADDHLWVLANETQRASCRFDERDLKLRRLPGMSLEVCEIPNDYLPTVQSQGLELITPPMRIVLHLGELLKRYGHELLGMQEVQRLLDSLEKTHPVLVHETVPKIVSLATLTEILRSLAAEAVSIRQLSEILQVLADKGILEKDPAPLTEQVRVGLRRALCFPYLDGQGALRVLLLDRFFEQAISESIQRTSQGMFLAIEPELAREMIVAVQKEVERISSTILSTEPYVLLTRIEVRRFVRQLLEVDLPQMPVLSHAELVPTLTVHPIATVSVTK